MNLFAVTLCGLIVAILVLRALWVLRQEARQPHGGRPRGIAPGEGYEEIVSDYSTGAGGGSRLVTRVPRDPQEYARVFVPRRNKEK
ncbi:hypothetical protein [Jannaschia ovalis]|uniref:Secreted protein n=1 Tax=Jannaschia ovalis TaxID=3038773 RepID=A0ABY8LA03_9RHOB|nr:hypothetical protein [Jannaschia sp. GRR-S6-38]WGH78177.1 hypothetical protein P8627_14240 [Jannaschia sp. GRR-S6-38]